MTPADPRPLTEPTDAPGKKDEQLEAFIRERDKIWDEKDDAHEKELAKLEAEVARLRGALGGVRDVYRDLHPGTCRIVSLGAGCQCFHCRLDALCGEEGGG